MWKTKTPITDPIAGMKDSIIQLINISTCIPWFCPLLKVVWSEGDRVTMMTLIIILSIQLCPLLGKEFDQSGKLLNPAPNDWMKNNTLHIKLFVAHSSYE
jgi:hypothetical protein